MATKVKLIETGAVTGNIIPDGGIATGKLADDAVTTIKISDANITHAKLHTSMDLTGKTVTVATASGSTNTTAAASTAFVQQELTTLIGGAPSTLNDLNELAAAINDDANYNSTLTTALATKLPLAGGTMTGTLLVPAVTVGNSSIGSNSSHLANITINNNGYIGTTYDSASLNFTTAGDLVATGKLGIGTAVNTAPSAKLHIQGSGSFNHTPGQNTTSDFIITSSEMGDNNAHSIMQLVSVRQSLSTGSGSTGYLGFSTMDDSNGQGIRDAGRFAIVNEVGSSRNSPTALSFWTNAGGTDTTAATEKMRITSAGKIGIGFSATPNAFLQVGMGEDQSAPAAGAGTAAACFGNDTSANAYGLILGADGFGKGYISAQRTDGTATTYDLSIQPNGGNVGIGTTTPSAPLSLLDASLTTQGTGEGGLRVHRPNAASQYGYFDYGYNGGGVNIGSFYSGGGAASFGTFTFRQHSSTTSQIPMFIGNTGNIGIGTTSPDAHLDISAAAGTTGSNAPTLRLTNSSNVDYTVGSPIGALEYYHSESSGAAFPGVAASIKAVVEVTHGHQVGLAFSTANVDTAATERMRISTNGNVGIGTSSPAGPLHVDGHTGSLATILEGNGNGDTVPLHFRVKANNNNVTNHGIFGNAGSTGADNSIHIGPSNTSGLRVNAAGKVFIGVYTASNAQFRVKQTTNSEWAANIINQQAIAYGLSIDTTSSTALTTYNFAAYTPGNSGFFIRNSGNVGIGVSQANHLLDILKTGSGDAAIQIKSTTGGDPTLIFNSAAANRQGIIKFQDNGTNVGRIDYVHSADRIDIQAGSATSSTMSILNNRVVIGTTSADTSASMGGQTPALSVVGYTSLGGLRVAGNDSGNTIYKSGGNITINSATHNVKVQGASQVNLQAGANDMFRAAVNKWSLGGGTYGHGKVRSYHYHASLSAGATVALLQNTNAHTDVNFIYWIEAFHSSRSYRTGMGTFGGYGMHKTSASNGGLDIYGTAAGTGLMRLDIAANTSYATSYHISMMIFGDSPITVHNGTLADGI